jgi:hypothetical protein
MKSRVLVLCVGIPALGSVACGASAGSTDNAHRDDTEIGSVNAPLVLDTTTCETDPALRSIGPINPNADGDINSTESSSMASRRPHCNAWVTDFTWSQTNNANKVYVFPDQKDPLPTDQTNCNAVWETHRVLGYFGNGAHTVLQNMNEFHTTWEGGGSCQWTGDIATPTCPTCGMILRLWADADNWIEWPQSYSALRVISQPMYAYWPIPASTGLVIQHDG